MSDQILVLMSLSALILSAFFSGCESAFLSASRIRLRHAAGRGSQRAKRTLEYIHHPEYFLSVVLVGTNLANIGCTVSFTTLVIRHYGDSGVTLATVVLVPVILMFGEILPKGIFLYYADKASVLSIYPLRIFSAILYPMIKFFTAFANFVMKVFHVKKKKKRFGMTMEELLFHLEGSEEAGLIASDTKTFASQALKLHRMRAKDVMMPLDDVVMVGADLAIDSYKAVLAKTEYSRLPVYKGKREHVVGILSIHNVLKFVSQRTKRLVFEPSYVISLDHPIAEVLLEMKDKGCHMAMVQDDSAHIVGMATMEDIIERIVGEITDEFH
ncbi:MAG: hemolysin family protein [Candidatus Latescibacterota bacterium]